MKAALKPWLEAGLGLVYPEVCQICGLENATATEGFMCAQCAKQVRFIVPPFCDRCGLPFEGDISDKFDCFNCKEMDLRFRYARSVVVAKGVMLEVIHRYKYSHALWFEPVLADLLAREAAPRLVQEGCDMIVPVPLHSAKHREREFNQSERLADCLGRATGIPVNKKLLKRVEPTQTQTRLTRQQRAANVARAFAVAPGTALTGKRIAVLDDVFTTGATTSACAKVLVAAGARDVCVWTVARGV